MGLDILSFDRLIQQAQDIRKERLIEEASILRLAVGSAFSGESKPFEQFVTDYSPEHLQQEQENEMIGKSVRQLKDIFGG